MILEGLINRHKHALERKRGWELATNRSEWSISRKIYLMYEHINEELGAAGIQETCQLLFH
jgi:hypothetical protein